MRTLAALAVAAAIAACSRGAGPSSDDDAVVVVRSAVDDAVLWVDGRYIGPLDELAGGVRVDPGPHRFELRHDDYFSYYAELDLAPREKKKLVVELSPVLP